MHIPDGFIRIIIDAGNIEFINSGKDPGIDVREVFSEFKKGKESSGLGLGLSIAQKICEQYGISLNYEYNDNIHRVLVGLKT